MGSLTAALACAFHVPACSAEVRGPNCIAEVASTTNSVQGIARPPQLQVKGSGSQHKS